jgi:hypothetical protein
MHRLARLALMFLLAIALPLQGFGAATMISCGPGHRHTGVPTTTHSHEGVDAGHRAIHEHDAGAHAHAADHSPVAKADLAKAGMHKCSACASCCTGAAAPAQAIVFPTVKLTDHFAPLATRSVPAHVSEGLERPPRAFLA